MRCPYCNREIREPANRVTCDGCGCGCLVVLLLAVMLLGMAIGVLR